MGRSGAAPVRSVNERTGCMRDRGLEADEFDATVFGAAVFVGIGGDGV
jgi:hypothetical protein